MRKALVGLAVSALMLPALAGSAAANAGWSVEFQSATLLAKGAAVEVTFDVTCPPTATYFSTAADVTQVVNRRLIASGDVVIYPRIINNYPDPPVFPDLTCDSVTANPFSGLVYSDTGVAFKNGVALVTVRVTPGGMGQPGDLDSVEVKLRRAK